MDSVIKVITEPLEPVLPPSYLDADDDKPWVCSICPKAFAKEGQKDNHEKIHYEEKKHKCVYCEKAFREKRDLMRHERIHTGEMKKLLLFKRLALNLRVCFVII